MLPEHEVLTHALQHALDHIAGLETAPVGATASLAELRHRLGHDLTDVGIDPEEVIDALVADSRGGILGSAGGRFYGWVIGGSLPAALAADWLTAIWDQNAALYACGPAVATIEEIAGRWLLDLLGLPSTASFAFVSGCQMAHVTCLAAARHRLLEARGWNAEDRGLAGSPPIRVLTTTERHGSIERAVRLLGLGRSAIETIESDAEGRLRPDALQFALVDQPERPTIVILQAGDLNIAAFDPFAEVIPLAHAHDAWVHIDGAFGLWAASSRRYRHLLTGYEGADSWATDGHKWLNVPYDSGFAFVADPTAHRAAMSHRESYLTHADDARDQIDWNPEWSRRARGVPVYAALRSLGRDGVEEMIDRCARLAHRLTVEIGTLTGAELIYEPRLNQGLVRFLDRSPGAVHADHDRRTDEMIARIAEDGDAFFSGTTWRGKRCMRISVCNWRTNDVDVDRTVRAIGRLLG